MKSSRLKLHIALAIFSVTALGLSSCSEEDPFGADRDQYEDIESLYGSARKIYLSLSKSDSNAINDMTCDAKREENPTPIKDSGLKDKFSKLQYQSATAKDYNQEKGTASVEVIFIYKDDPNREFTDTHEFIQEDGEWCIC